MGAWRSRLVHRQDRRGRRFKYIRFWGIFLSLFFHYVEMAQPIVGAQPVIPAQPANKAQPMMMAQPMMAQPMNVFCTAWHDTD